MLVRVAGEMQIVKDDAYSQRPVVQSRPNLQGLVGMYAHVYHASAYFFVHVNCRMCSDRSLGTLGFMFMSCVYHACAIQCILEIRKEKCCGALNNLANYAPAADAIDGSGGILTVTAAMKKFTTPQLLKLGSGVLLCIVRRDRSDLKGRMDAANARGVLEYAVDLGIAWAALVLKEIESPFADAVSHRIARDDWKRAGRKSVSLASPSIADKLRAVVQRATSPGLKCNDSPTPRLNT